MVKAEMLVEKFGVKGNCGRSFLLDAAKIIDEY
jgi:hypothetical protein